MPRKIPRPQVDYTGQRFGKLTAIAKSHQSGRITFWEYRCDCGNTKVAPSALVCNDHIRDCGCVVASHEYTCWKSMKRRCNNPNSTGYENYGGRGIKVCPEWNNSFDAFLLHIGPSPTPKHTIERLDNSADYVPGNVRWATRKEQANNRRTNRLITHNGETMNTKQWADRLGVRKTVISNRLRLGWSDERTVTESLNPTPQPRT